MKKYKINTNIKIPAKYYYLCLVGIPAIGIVMKNILLQAFMLGSSMYEISLLNAIRQTWRYWLIYLAVTMLLLNVSLLFKKDIHKKIYIVLVDILITALIYCDLIYNRSFYTMPSAVNLAMLTNFSGMDGGEVTSLLSGYDILLFLDIVILILYIIFVRKNKNDEQDEKVVRKKSYVISTVMCVFTLVIIPTQAKTLKVNESTYEDMYLTNNANDQAKYFSSIGFHVKDIYEIISDAVESDISDEEKEQIKEFYEWNKSNYSDEYKGIFNGKNVIFLQIESLEDFVIGEKIDGQEITPNLNKMIQKGIYFSNIYEEVKAGNSSDADLMYMTSILPSAKGCTFYRFPDVELNSLPRLLASKGYSTEYHQAIDAKFWNYKQALTNMIGIQKFCGIDTYKEDEKIGFTISDESFLNQTFEQIKDNKEPYYCHIVCNSSHMPFNISDEHKHITIPDELESTYGGKYVECINYVDKCIGDFIQKLDKEGMLEDTVVVVIGDHTGLHKYYEHTLKTLYDKYPWFEVDGKYCVPYIIYSKGDYKSYSSDINGNQIDVMPTLSYLLGESDDSVMNTAMGRNLFDKSRNFALFRDGDVLGEVNDYDKNIISGMYDISNNIFKMME